MRNLALIAALVAGLWLASKGYVVPLAIAVAAVLVFSTKARRAVLGHSHGGGLARVARHEAGHVVAARAVGGRVLSARASAGGGRVEWDMSDRDLHAEVRSNVTFLRAAEYVDPVGCGGDRSEVRRQLRRLPAKDRARVRADAEAHARRIASGRSGEIRRVAARLEKKGRL